MKIRFHWQRERRRDLVIMAKTLFRSTHDDRLFCEACGFDFGKIYGEPDFIEAHHKTPLRDLEVGAKTKLSDFVMVCANCHRMLHYGTPWLTVDELKRKMESVGFKPA
jgi:predicted HNH restriction endonuclease